MFKLNKVENRPFEIDGLDFVAGIDIQNNLDQTVLIKISYTTLDVLANVGGLATALSKLVVAIIGLMNYNQLENFMASRVYRINADDADADADEKDDKLSCLRRSPAKDHNRIYSTFWTCGNLA